MGVMYVVEWSEPYNIHSDDSLVFRDYIKGEKKALKEYEAKVKEMESYMKILGKLPYTFCSEVKLEKFETKWKNPIDDYIELECDHLEGKTTKTLKNEDFKSLYEEEIEVMKDIIKCSVITCIHHGNGERCNKTNVKVEGLFAISSLGTFCSSFVNKEDEDRTQPYTSNEEDEKRCLHCNSHYCKYNDKEVCTNPSVEIGSSMACYRADTSCFSFKKKNKL